MKCVCCSAAGNYNNPKPISLWRKPVGGVNGSGGRQLGVGGCGWAREALFAVSFAQQRSRLEILRLLFNFSLTQHLDIRSF